MKNFETTITEMNVEIFERIAEIRNQNESDRIRHMVGIKLTNGRDVPMRTVNYIDCDIATGDMIGFYEYDDKIEVVRIKRENVLYKV